MCKVRYCAKHISEVMIDASPVDKEWVECPVGARLELLSNPREVRIDTFALPMYHVTAVLPSSNAAC